MAMEKCSLRELFAALNEYFSPKIVAAVDGVYIKVVKVKGQGVPWHTHDAQDEMFLVVKGTLTIELDGREGFDLNDGEFFVVEHGVRHRVSSVDECQLVLVENKDTEHTGDVRAAITKSIEDQLL
jgi:mannose-6-phosphate isomerase-like protein (cupin superfamily)